MNKDITVILLAGGKSSRFWPLPNKLTQSVLGRTFLEHQLDMFKSVGFKRLVLVTTPELADRVSGETIHTVIQKGDGQGAAVLSAAEYVKDKPILIVNADDLVAKSLFESVLYTIDKRKNLLVGYKTRHYFPGGYMVLEGKKVAKIHEKPGEGNEPSSFVKLVCDYFYSANGLFDALKKTDEKDSDRHYENALSLMMETGDDFEMLEYEDLWIPIKYSWDMLRASEYFLGTLKRQRIAKSAKISKTAVIVGPVILDEGVRVMEYAKIVGPTYIGAGTIIGDHTLVRDSMIGEHNVIGFGSEITRSYIGDNSWFHTNYVGDSVIASNVGVGAGAIFANLRLDELEIRSSIKGEPINTKRVKLGALIGEGARVGIGAQVMPGVKVGKNSIVGPGVILTRDLFDSKRCFITQTYTLSENLHTNSQDRERFRTKL